MFEFEQYSLMAKLLHCLYAFESGDRNILKGPDYHELLGELKYDYKRLKGNIEHFELYKKESNKKEEK